MSLPWFKHYNTAHDGHTMAMLWAENDTETIAFYWTLLEMISRYESNDARGKVELSLSLLRTKLNMKSSRSRRLLTKISQRFKLDLEWISGESFQLYLPNWLELQETRGGKREAKTEQKSVRREKREERREIQRKNASDDAGANLVSVPKGGTLGTRIFAKFNECRLKKYGNTQERTQKVSAQMKAIAEHWTSDEAKPKLSESELLGLVEKYFELKDEYVANAQHPIGLFRERIPALLSVKVQKVSRAPKESALDIINSALSFGTPDGVKK